MENNRSRKKRKIEDQIKGNIDTPPQIIKDVVPTNGFITFTCPSTKIKDVKYNITLGVDDSGKIFYKCECRNYVNDEIMCKHIRACLAKTIISTIENHNESEEAQDVFDALKNFTLNAEIKDIKMKDVETKNSNNSCGLTIDLSTFDKDHYAFY